MRKYALLSLFFCASLIASAQTNYRTNGTGGGDWNNPATWEIFNGSSWVSAVTFPTSADGTIQIRTSDVVNVTASVSINQTTIDAGGTIRLVGGTLTTSAASDLIVNGTFEFARNGGTTVPIATWNTGSLCNITGIVGTGISTANGGLAPASGFYDFTWNCIGQTVNVTIPINTIHGSFSLLASGGKVVTFNSGTGSLNVDGDISINNSGGTLSSGAIAISATNFTLTAGSFTAPSTSITLSGNLSIDGTYTNNTGSLIFGGSSVQAISGSKISTTNFNSVVINGSATVAPQATFNIKGDFTDNGTLSAGANTVNFTGINTQTISGTANTQFYNFTVNKTGGSLTVSSSKTVTNNLTLTAGTFNINAPLNVTSASAIVTLTAGTMANSSNNLSLANGSTISRAGGTMTTSSPSGGPWNLIYTGGSKTTGLEIPASGNLTSLTLNTNSGATVTLLAGQDVNVTNALTISSAGRTFTSGANNVTVGSFSNAGTFNAPTSAATTGLVLNGDLANSGTFNNNSGTVVIAGTSTITGSKIPTLYNFLITPAGSFTAGSPLTIQGNFTNNGAFSSGTNTITFSAGNAQTISGSNSVQFYDVNVNKTAGTIITLTGSASVTNSLTLTNGILDNSSNALNISSGATVKRSAGSISSFGLTGGPWNLIYFGSSSFTTGFEIPASGVLTSLSSTNTGTITLNNSLTIGAGGFTENGGKFVCGANAVTTEFIDIVKGNFNAPSTTLTVTGDVTIDGTYTNSSGLLVFSGSAPQTISGAAIATANFYSVTINSGATVNPPSTFNILGNFVNDGTLNTGTGTVVFKGANTTISGSTDTQFYNLTLNKGGTLTLTQAVTVTNNLTLTTGTFANASNLLTVQSGATIYRAGGTITTNSPLGGPWDVVYTGTSKTTSFEIPSSGSVGDVTMNTNATTTITLNKNLVVIGDLTIVNSTNFFTCSKYNVTVNSLVNGGTFNAPTNLASVGLTINSSLVNNGTFNPNLGTVIFSGVGSISGTTIPVFNNFTVSSSGTFNALQDITVQGNFKNDGTFTGGSNTVYFTGGTAQTISGTSAALFNDINVNKSANAVSVNSSETVNGTLTLTAGNLFNSSNLLAMANGATIDVVGGTMLGTSPSGGPWNLSYSGTSAINATGFEVPTLGSLLSLTTTNTSSVTLTKNLTVGSGGFIVNASTGSFICGNNTVSTSSLTITSGTFVAPTTTVTLTSGDLTINGTYTNNGGALVFGGSSSQTILGSNAPSTNFNSITTNNGAILTAPSTLKVLGTLQNDGSFVAGTGTVTFSDASSNTTAQIAGSSKITFYNITVANGGAAIDLILENSSGADLRNVLDIGASTFDADGAGGNRVFTLLSTSDKPTVDASIAQILSGGSVSGDVTVQRYMGRSGVAAYQYQVWRDISAPVDSDVADIQNSIPVTGPFSGSSTVSGADYSTSSMQKYVDPTSDVNLDGKIDTQDGYKDFPVSINTEQFVKGVGYTTFIFGTDSELITPGSDLWSLRGPIHSDPVTPFNLPVVYTTATGKTSSMTGWNLIGNPYPSTIDWTKLTRNKINNAIYVDDYSTATPVYASWVNGVSTNGGTPYIPMGQGFWVKASAASPTLTITESAKVPGTQTTFFREAAPEKLLRVTLSSTANQRDETVIYFSNNATPGFDEQLDAIKLFNRGGHINLSSVSEDKERYAINAVPFSGCSKTIALDVANPLNGTYSLQFSQFESFPSSMKIQLRDNFTNALIDVSENQNYSFEVDSKNTQTYGSSRFSIVFTNNGSGSSSLIAQGTAVCDPSSATVIIKNSSTDLTYSINSSANGQVVVKPTPGNGQDLVLTIPTSSVSEGANSFVAKQVSSTCESLTSSQNVTVNYSPRPVISEAKSVVSCKAGVVTLSASGAPADGHYLWYPSQTGDNAYSVTTSTFVTPSIVKSTSYFVSAVNAFGCEGPRVAVQADIVNLQPAEIVITDLHTIQSNYSEGNQWYFNDAPIVGATNKVLDVKESGNYKLVVSQLGCSVSASKEMLVDGSGGAAVNIYPNPTKGRITVEASGEDEASGEIYNSVGIRISALQFANHGGVQKAFFSFASEGSGIYFVRVNQGDRIKVVRIVKD